MMQREHWKRRWTSMKTAEEIKRVLRECDEGYACKRIACPFDDGKSLLAQSKCITDLRKAALAYIQQLEALVPPVVVGTQIFSVCYSEDNDGFYVKSGVVAEIWYNCNGWFFLEECHVGPAFKKSDIGKLIYLSREEAELVCEEFRAKSPLPGESGEND